MPLPQALCRCVRPTAQPQPGCSFVTTVGAALTGRPSPHAPPSGPRPRRPHAASPPPPPPAWASKDRSLGFRAAAGLPAWGPLSWTPAASQGQEGASVGPQDVRWPCCPRCSAHVHVRVQDTPRGALSTAPVAARPRTGAPCTSSLLGVGEERRVHQASHPTPVSGALPVFAETVLGALRFRSFCWGPGSRFLFDCKICLYLSAF